MRLIQTFFMLRHARRGLSIIFSCAATKRLAIGAILLFCLGTANAALIDNGTYTTDNVSGLDWLDLSASMNMTMTGALAAHSGWRFASNAEVEDLFGQLFPGFYATDAMAGTSDSLLAAYAEQDADLTAFQSLFGFANNYYDQLYINAIGVYIDEDSRFRGMGGYFIPATNSSVILGPEYNGAYEPWYDTRGTPGAGVYLVRTSVVPIPAAAYLFASGLGLLRWMRRKQTA